MKKLGFSIFLLFVMIDSVICENKISFGSFSEDSLYLIITTEDYLTSTSLAKFVEYRRREFFVEVVTNTLIGDSADDYRNFIIDRNPDYVLLVGDYTGDIVNSCVNKIKLQPVT